MNELEIEKLLRKAPQPKVPVGLLETLQDEITLRPQVHTRREFSTSWSSLWKRWLRSAAYCLCLVICAAMVQVQFQTIRKLREEIRQLQETARNIDQLRAANLEYQNLLADNQQLNRLQKENVEMQSLRSEAVGLREQLEDSNSVHIENQQLRADIQNWAPEEVDVLTKLKREAEVNKCVNNLRNIDHAARVWANGHKGDFLPKDFASMTNEIGNAKYLVCPADKARKGEEIDITWDNLKRGAVSYEIVTPGASSMKPDVVFVRCPFHNNIGLVDGSVQISSWTNHYELDKNNALHLKQP